jgi:hypothetical protein
MSNEDATRSEIDALRVEPVAPGLVAVALSLARQLDAADAPSAAAVVARELRATLLELRKAAPIGEEGDAVDDLTRKREERRAAALGRQQSG